MKAQKLNRRQARWALYLSRFDFTLKHVAGSKMGKADVIILCRANLDSHLEVAGFVQVQSRNMKTLIYIQKGINVNSKPEPERIPKLKHTGD